MKCPTTLTTIICQVPHNYHKEYQVLIPVIKKEKKTGKKKKIKKVKKWNKNKRACAQGAGRVRRGQGCCLLVIYGQSYDVSSWWTTEERQKRPDEHSQDEGRDKAEKKKKSRPQGGGGFSLSLYLCAWCFEVIWCVWYRKVCRDISWHHVRYHAISQGTVYRDIVQVSYLYPEFLGLMWRYRIPWIYFSISNTIFCQLGAPSLVHQK